MTRAKSVAPTLRWSTGSTTRRARSMTAALSAASARLPTLTPSSEKPLTPRNADAEGEALEVLEREVAHHGPVDAPQLAAEQHAVDRRHLGERGGHAEAAGEDGQPERVRLAGELPGQGLDGGPAVEEHGVAVARGAARHASAIASLPAAIRVLAARELAIGVGMDRERASVRALEQARAPAAR